MGQSKKSNQKGKTLFSFFKIYIYIYIKVIESLIGLAIQRLKELYINDLFERKQMIEDLEAELTGSLFQNSNTDNLAVDEEANVDEAITAESKASNEM